MYYQPPYLMALNVSAGGTSATWQDAVQSFLSSLGPNERAAFQVPASPDDCVGVLLATQRRKSKLSRILELMQPAIEPLKRFESAIDVIVQVNAGIASPIWGPLRIVVTLAADHFRTLESVAMIVHRIISSLQRFSKYEEMFEKNRLVQDAVGVLYCDYIDFCVRVTRFYSASSFRTLFVSFDKDFRDVAEKIQLHSQNMDWAAHAAHIEETQREAENAKAERKAHERGNIQRWLSPSTVDDDLQKHLDDCIPRSCDRLLASCQFQSFISLDDTNKPPPVLAIQGLPGSGKTTAAAFIIDQLKTKGFEVLYFFFKANGVEKRTLLSCLRTLLAQLLRLEEHLYDSTEPFYRESGRVVADSLAEVQRAFSAALQHSKAKQIFVVLDALDESSQSTDITQWITACQDRSERPQLRILITSRPSPSFSKPSNLSWSILKMGSYEKASVNSYILLRVQKNPIIRDTKVGASVADHVISATQGLWLYARLMMDDIDRLPSVGQIQKQLRVLPKGFTELYTQIIRTTEANYNAIELKLAQQLHLWVDPADYLPSFLVLRDDRIGYGMLELIFQYANDGEEVHDPTAQASRVSGPLIEIFNDETADSTDSQAYELDFIHYTAAQYLCESNDLPFAQLPLTLRPRRLRHLHRAAVAIWYFTECKQSEELLLDLRWNEGRPARSLMRYFEMAYGLWNALHLVEFPDIQDSQEAAEAEALLQKLTEFISTSACLRWVESAVIINYEGKFPHLLWNATKAWKAGKDNENHQFAPYQAFSKSRIHFFQNYAYVLALTGLGAESVPRELLDSAQERVLEDELSREILSLGERWRRLIFSGLD
ncbi:uncharacterized protein F4812DRAFT_126275 [Daldinia caldariorum]|uniref:uncharacterized protein n=1 Tax=Daldinia caldariorum TaxID=326644 RepID=UPI0020077021|nr:uncharacterized protein F4812DRAFT_126275 [Daldinia caldariorum]KAI1465505.1 hypothetical protein F4812DRAFT_126275 [Daldinia caldariorum]